MPHQPIDDKTLAEMLHRATEVCHTKKLRMTPQRFEVYKEVASSTEHLDAETVFKRVQDRLPNISLDTVYRTLSTLEEVGLLTRINSLCGRARFDANQIAHHHFICKKCHAVLDIFLSPEEKERLSIPQMSNSLGEAESLHVQIHGICNACKEGEQENPEDKRST